LVAQKGCLGFSFLAERGGKFPVVEQFGKDSYQGMSSGIPPKLQDFETAFTAGSVGASSTAESCFFCQKGFVGIPEVMP
jgi:hypothetical protein